MPPVPSPRGPVILVHGLWMVGAEMLWLARGLRRAGFGPVRRFHYPSVRHGLAANARRLADFRQRVEARHGPAHLVGHSLGGVVVWQLFHDHGGGAEPGGRVVALGAPFQGSATARFFLRRGRWGRFAVGACWRRGEDHSPPPGRLWPARPPWASWRAGCPSGWARWSGLCRGRTTAW